MSVAAGTIADVVSAADIVPMEADSVVTSLSGRLASV